MRLTYLYWVLLVLFGNPIKAHAESVAIFVDGISFSASGTTFFENLTGPAPIRVQSYLASESVLPALIREPLAKVPNHNRRTVTLASRKRFCGVFGLTLPFASDQGDIFPDPRRGVSCIIECIGVRHAAL